MTSARKQVAKLVALVAVLLAGVANLGAPPAQAEVDTFNPLDVNRGFTVVAQGDAVLGNGELEGSVAAFGALSSTVDNYPVRHQASGIADYLVPTIDDEPVRILARELTGVGNIDLTNMSNENVPPPSAPESRAIAKFVDTRGLRAVDGGQFTRLLSSTNQQEGRLDVKALPYAHGVVRDRVQADLAGVGAYFDVADQPARTSRCLPAMYDAEPSVVNWVDFTVDGEFLHVAGFDGTRPNVFPYDDVKEKVIKRDGAASTYVPSAHAPIIIKVAAGTTKIGRINFEGWSADRNAEQSYARHILLDLSEVTGTVTIDELELGSIWAPHADLVFSSEVSTNGQWFANDVTTSGGGEIRHHTFLGRLPCPAPPAGGFTLTKVVAGDSAPLPGDPEFTFDVTIGAQHHVVRLADGQSRSFDGLAPGTRVSVSERPVADPDGAVFDGVRFTLDGPPVDPVNLSIEAGSHHAIVATNTFSIEPSPVLALVKNLPNGDPTDWTLTATAPGGTPVITGQGTATGPVSAGVRYTLAESGGPAEYVPDGEWQCTGTDDHGADVAVDVAAGAVVVPRRTDVTCTVTNVTATLTLLKLVTGDTELVPADWELSATPSAGVTGLSTTTVGGAESPGDANTFPVRPEHDYVLGEQPEVPETSLQIALERYVGPASDAPDHADLAHWERLDAATISVDRGAHEIVRFVNLVPSPIDLPPLGGLGSSALLTGGAAVAAAGLAVGVVLQRRRTGG